MASNTTPTAQLYPNEVSQLPMFYPYITKEEADSLIKQHNHGVGTYLIRPNTSLIASFVTISLSGPGSEVLKVRVFIVRDPKGSYIYFITRSITFTLFSDLLQHYRQNQIYVRQDINNLYLLRPLIIPPEHIPYVLAQIRGDINTSFLRTREIIENATDELLKTKSPSQPDMASSFSTSPQKIADDRGRNMMTEVPSTTVSHQIKNLSVAQVYLPEKPREGEEKSLFSSNTRRYSENDTSVVNNSQLSQRRMTIGHSRSLHRCDPLDDIKHRPPVPLPRDLVSNSDYIYESERSEYSEVDEHKNFFLELYQRLKRECECECGLNSEDSKLSDGWEVHIIRDEATVRGIFYQKGEQTVWNFPQEILSKISHRQIQFVLSLYREAHCTPPDSLVSMLHQNTTPSTQSQQNKQLHAIPDLMHDNNVPLSSTTSSSSSSTSPPSSSSSLRLDVKVASQQKTGGLSFCTQQVPSCNLPQQPLPQQQQHQQECPFLKQQTSISSLSSSSTTPSDAAFYEIPSVLFNSLTLNNTALNISQEQPVPCVGTYIISGSGELELQPYENQENITMPPPVSSLVTIAQNQPVKYQQMYPQSTAVINHGNTSGGGTKGISNGSSGSGDSYSGSGGSGVSVSNGGRNIVKYEDVSQLHQVVFKSHQSPTQQQQQQLLQKQQEFPSHYLMYDPYEQQQQPHQNLQTIHLQPQLPNQRQEHQYQQQLQQPPQVHQQTLPVQLQQIPQKQYENLLYQQLFDQNSQYLQLQQQPQSQQPLRHFPQQEHQQIILQNTQPLQLQHQFQIQQQEVQEKFQNKELQQKQQDELIQQRMHLSQVYHQQQQTQPPRPSPPGQDTRVNPLPNMRTDIMPTTTTD